MDDPQEEAFDDPLDFIDFADISNTETQAPGSSRVIRKEARRLQHHSALLPVP